MDHALSASMASGLGMQRRLQTCTGDNSFSISSSVAPEAEGCYEAAGEAAGSTAYSDGTNTVFSITAKAVTSSGYTSSMVTTSASDVSCVPFSY